MANSPTTTKAKSNGKGNGKAEAETAAADETVDRFEIPEDLATLDDADLDDANEDGVLCRAQRAMDAMAETQQAAAEEGHAPSDAEVQAVRDLAAAIKGLKAEAKTRRAAAAERTRDFQAAVADVTAQDDEETGGGEDDGTEAESAGGEETPSAESQPGGEGDEPAEAGEVVTASTRRGPLKIELTPKKPTLNPRMTLADIARKAPNPGVNAVEGPEVVITAASDVPGLANGARIATLADLADATTRRARNMGVTMGSPQFAPLATINRQFPVVMDEDTQTPQQMATAFEDMIAPIRDSSGGMEALVAAGGWCAPSEIRYDFFNIAAAGGMFDVPTFGVNRGGIRFPLNGGISLFDFFALAGAPTAGLPTNATMPWEWTEADDIAAATGASPTKVCLRPGCPTFDEQRLRVFGLCVLAGNLTEDAYPELIRDFIAKTVVAHARVINRRLLLLAAAASTATTPTAGASTAMNAWLGGLELNAIDYREKHGMPDGAVLEVVAPSWVRGVLRSDVAKKNGVERYDAADAWIMDQFDVRRLRVQFVSDWQTRLGAGAGIAPANGAIPATWPATADAMMFAPGTFGRGNGLRLDLGVTRDSVLNADNDHTAAWSEEATLLAKLGHESRLITLNTVAGGTSGQQTALTGA